MVTKMGASFFEGEYVTAKRVIYTPSAFARTSLIHLQETGVSTARKPHVSRRSGLLSYLFFIVEKGEGSLTCQGQTMSLKANDCVFLDCRNAYSQQSAENLWTIRWVHFYGPNLTAVYEKYKERGGSFFFHASSPQVFSSLLEDIYQTASSPSYIRDMKLNELLSRLLTLLMDNSWNPPLSSPSGSHTRRNLQEVKDYLDSHYREKITLDQLAEQYYINKFYLSRLFKEQFGISPLSYLLSVRITHAKQLLRFDSLPVEKIAQECGMNDANYFSRIFRKIEGSSPGEFRKHWQNMR